MNQKFLFLGVILTTLVIAGGCSKKSAEQVSTLNPQQKWALATSALPKKANDWKLDIMGGGNAEAEHVDDLRTMLKDDWEVVDHNTAVNMLKFLRESGHREEFDNMVREISQMNDADFKNLLYEYSKQPEVRKQLEFVRKNINVSSEKSIKAWDYCRLIYVAECSCRAGYLTEKEAWQEILSAAKVIQSTFSSWDDMANNYLLGREFWAGERSTIMNVACKILTTDAKSPWRTYPWNLKLDETGKI